MTTVYLLAGDWPGHDEDDVSVLPDYSMAAIAGGEHFALKNRANPIIERRSIPSPNQGTSEIRAFFDHGYQSVESTVANQVPRVAVSAPNLGVVYGAVLDADFRPRAFYECREGDDGLYHWSEVDSDQFRGADSIERFQQLVGTRDTAASRGESPEQLHQRDDRLLGNTLGRHAILGVIDANDEVRRRTELDARLEQYAAEATPTATQQEPEPVPTPPPAEPDPAPENLRFLDPDQGFFSSARRIPSQQNWQYEPPSAVYAGTDRVVANLRGGRWNTHNVDNKWAMTVIDSVKNALTADHDFGSSDRKFEDQMITVQGDAGLAVRRIDLDSGTMVQLLQPTGETDPKTGVPLGEWVDFPQEDRTYTTDRYLTNWRRWLMHDTNLKSPENMDTWVNGARNFLAGSLQEDGTRANDGYEAYVGLTPLSDEARHASLGYALQDPEAVANIRRRIPARPQPPALPRWVNAIRQARLLREQQERARRQPPSGPGSPGWVSWDGGGGMSM